MFLCGGGEELRVVMLCISALRSIGIRPVLYESGLVIGKSEEIEIHTCDHKIALCTGKNISAE
jgi:hypothetical protein